MIGLLCFVLAVLTSPFKSRLRLEAENAALRHQLMVLRRRLQGRIRLTNHDRWFLIQLYRWFRSILSVLTIVRPASAGAAPGGVGGKRPALSISRMTSKRQSDDALKFEKPNCAGSTFPSMKNPMP